MIIKYFFFSLFICLTCCSSLSNLKKEHINQAKLKILKIGNSISYWHGQNELFQELINCNASSSPKLECICYPGSSIIDIVTYDLNVLGGVTIRSEIMEADDSSFYKNVLSEDWNAVFIQDRDFLESDKRDFSLAQIMKRTLGSRKFIFQNYSNILFDEVLNQNEINMWDQSNKKYVDKYGLEVVPVGDFFKYSFYKNKVTLFDEDGHPNKLGAEAIVLMYYYSFFFDLPKQKCLDNLNLNLITDLLEFYAERN